MTRPVVMTLSVAKSGFQECVEQRRWKPGHYMVKVTILLIAVICALSAPAVNSRQPNLKDPRLEASDSAPNDQGSAIHLSIATVGPMLGPPTDRYRVGDQVPIAISLTNTSSEPTYACVSSDLYQDLPRLKKNGRLLPYAKWQSDWLANAQKNQTCQHEDLPESTLLKTNQSTVVDFLVLVDDSRFPTGAVSWYPPLTPGAYELSLQRRIGCCDGPMIESNKISFEVVP